MKLLVVTDAETPQRVRALNPMKVVEIRLANDNSGHTAIIMDDPGDYVIMTAAAFHSVMLAWNEAMEQTPWR